MAPPPLGYFEWPTKLPPKRRAVKVRTCAKTGELLKDFITKEGKHLYDDKYKQPTFLDALCNCASEMGAYRDELFLYQCLFPDMIALQHTNLQSDNAYYWYNSKDDMDAGLIDWGGAS